MARTVRKSIYPFLRPDPERVFAKPWIMPSGDQLESVIQDWDYQTDIRLIKGIVLDTPAIFNDCALGVDTLLKLAVIARSSSSGEKVCCLTREIYYSDHPEEVTLEVSIEHNSLGGALELSTILTLGVPGSTSSDLAPYEPGSRLWEQHDRFLLEGSGSRFPMEVLDFLDVGWLPSEAGWYLDWMPGDLEQPFLGTVRLLINRRHNTVVKAMTSKEPDEQDLLVLSAIYHDLGRSLITGALENQDFVESTIDYEDGSVGKAVNDILQLYFPGESRLTLCQRARNEAEEFNAQLRHHFKLFQIKDGE